MYVCVCNAVTEHHIHHAAALGACSLRDLRHTLGVTAECGRCARCAHDCLQSALGANIQSEPASKLAVRRKAFPASLEAS